VEKLIPERPYPWSIPEAGDAAPTFSPTRGATDPESFDLEDALGDGPIVLAFFPGALTPRVRTR